MKSAGNKHRACSRGIGTFVLVVGLALMGPAHAQFKCTGKDGAITFQQAACATTQEQDAVVLRDRQAPSTAIQGQASADEWKRKAAQADWQRALREAMATGRVLIGMTREQLYQAIGTPNKINAGQYGARSKDQLIYYRNNRTLYVYIDDGIVTSLQDTDGASGAASQKKPCPSAAAIRDIEIDINKLQNRDNQALQVELHKQLKEARECR